MVEQFGNTDQTASESALWWVDKTDDRVSFDESFRKDLENLQWKLKTKETRETNASQDILETLETYPKTPEEVLNILQKYAAEVKNEIEENFSSKSSLDGDRWDFEVTLDKEKEWYSYILSTYGVETPFRLVPGDNIVSNYINNEQWKFVIEWNGEEYLTSLIWSTNSASSIKNILKYANSANKELYRCEDYKRLKKIPEAIANPANTKHLEGYREKFDTIMNKNEYSDLDFDATKDSSKSLSRRLYNGNGYIAARRNDFKQQQAPKIEAAFEKRQKEIEEENAKENAEKN